jgi:hypothetical protein
VAEMRRTSGISILSGCSHLTSNLGDIMAETRQVIKAHPLSEVIEESPDYIPKHNREMDRKLAKERHLRGLAQIAKWEKEGK